MAKVEELERAIRAEWARDSVGFSAIAMEREEVQPAAKTLFGYEGATAFTHEVLEGYGKPDAG